MSNVFDPIIERYVSILKVDAKCDPDNPTLSHHLVWMLIEIKNSTTMSETKKHRWLGYVQGCMVFKGLITVDNERELTRGIFNGK